MDVSRNTRAARQRRTPHARWWSVALALMLAVASLALAACGGSDSGDADTTTAADTATTAARPSFTPVKDGVLTIGESFDYPPFETIRDGEPYGFNVAVMTEVARRLGLEPEFKKTPFDTIFTSVAAHQFDVMGESAFITPERQDLVDFSIPYFTSSEVLVVNPSKTPDLRSASELSSGDVVGVLQNSNVETYAKQNIAKGGVQLKLYAEYGDMFNDLAAGRIAAGLSEQLGSAELLKDRPGLEIAETLPSDESITGTEFGYGFAKDDDDKREAIDAVLRAMMDDGTFADLWAQYVPDTPINDKYKPAG